MEDVVIFALLMIVGYYAVRHASLTRSIQKTTLDLRMSTRELRSAINRQSKEQ